jgi:pantetheine-phosphate adenylyltransferase
MDARNDNKYFKNSFLTGEYEMKDVIAIYGGTFDPPTNGHYHIIEKAVKIFNKVHIVVASNPDKKNYMFSVDKRVSMLQGMIEEIKFKFSLCDISVDILSENTYLASFAHNISSKSVLVRGIRDEIDFSYEQKLCRTNKLIQPNIETIYIMPDDSYSLVSSSWIKGLIGCNGWRNIIEQNTPPNVAIEIKENYLRQIFCKLDSNISTSNKDFFWKEICRLYKNRKYHGYDHLISMFEYTYCGIVVLY